jgi:hypothetical protein
MLKKRQIEVWYDLGGDSTEPTAEELAMIKSVLPDLLGQMKTLDDSEEEIEVNVSRIPLKDQKR